MKEKITILKPPRVYIFFTQEKNQLDLFPKIKKSNNKTGPLRSKVVLKQKKTKSHKALVCFSTTMKLICI